MARMDRYKKRNQQPVLRPAYPPDPVQMYVPKEEEGTSFQPVTEDDVYPDVYVEPIPAENYLYPDVYEEAVYEDEDYGDEMLPEDEYAAEYALEYPKQTHNGIWRAIVFVCIVCFAFMIYSVYKTTQKNNEANARFREMTNAVLQDTYAQGIYIDHVHIGGLTREQAKLALMRNSGYNQQDLMIYLEVEGYQWELTNKELPIQRNIDAKLDEAYAIGRKGSPERIGTGITPLQFKYAHRMCARDNTYHFYTEVTYDPATVRKLVQDVAAFVNRDPVDATLAFDAATRSFTITDEIVGLKVDEDALYHTLLELLNQKRYRESVRMEAQEVMPNITKVTIANSVTLISSYTTQTTSDKNRNNNVDLAAKAVNGAVLMPGEEFSFNQTTGQRTTEKGYLPAAAIAGGTTVDEVGGGVCQVSSTLFNAAVMADMTIISRSPHAWPSNYVDKGRDATVNWPNLDFVFRNDRNSPVYIVAYYQNRKCTVEIYGASLGYGEGRDVISQVVDVTEPPVEPIRNYNPELPYGTEKEVKKARTGYVVDTYKIYTRNGQEYKREKICSSVYRVIQQVIDYNY